MITQDAARASALKSAETERRQRLILEKEAERLRRMMFDQSQLLKQIARILTKQSYAGQDAPDVIRALTDYADGDRQHRYKQTAEELQKLLDEQLEAYR